MSVDSEAAKNTGGRTYQIAVHYTTQNIFNMEQAVSFYNA